MLMMLLETFKEKHERIPQGNKGKHNKAMNSIKKVVEHMKIEIE